MKKTLIGLLMTTVMLISLAAPLIAIPSVKAAAGDYMTVAGVLGSDYYSLYPYEKANLKIGFSKWGEMINSEDNVGLEYNSAVDPFAFPSGSSVSATVPKRMWVQGWFMNITYVHRTLGERWVWAGALHSDTVAYAGDWIRVDFANDKSTTYGLEDFRDPGYYIGAVPYGTTLVQGGRKTNGTCVTNQLEVLYDGPREFIGVARTTIYDHLVYGSDTTESDVPLVQLAITIRFDKVKKCVVLYKDVKSLLVEKEGIKMKIQFSNRGEVDLGTATAGISSYAHFWTQGTSAGNAAFNDTSVDGQPTVYNSAYELIQTENPNATEYGNFTALGAGPYPQASGATFDYAQAINPTAGYVWSGAFWPSLSDWSIDGWDQWWHSMTALDPHYIDYRTPADEPFIPFYIGEWDFVLYHTLDADKRTQFRGVTQYAVTALHDGSDANNLDGNVIDSEMLYYLKETFNPWDLNDAVHKDTTRHVEWCTSATTFTTKYPVVVDYGSLSTWDDYCVNTERVLKNNVTLLKPTFGTPSSTTYKVEWLADGKMKLTFNAATSAKILYSTEDDWSYSGLTYLDEYTEVVQDPQGPVVFDFAYKDDYVFAADPLGVVKAYGIDVDMVYNVVPGNYSITDPDLDDSKWDFWVDFEDGFEQNYFWYDDLVYASEGSGINATMQGSGANMWVNLTVANQDVWVNYMDIRMHLAADVVYDTPSGEETGPANLTITFAPYMSFVLEESRRGRYEFATVGRDAASVDSAGAALVAEALDSYKHIGVGLAAADMDNPVAANNMPSVMSKFGAGTTAADYKDSILRAALNDDWCTYWPVASSNMIGVGGPLANLLSYYVNDFTDAMYGTPLFSGAAYSGKIGAVSCLDRNWLNTTGYNTYTSFGMGPYYLGAAVISTYKDINGTVIFDVWGMEGRDTYFASLWLHGDKERGFTPGILEMQRFPKGVTSIVLYIWYSNNWKHPLYSIPEMLGTISETRMAITPLDTDGIFQNFFAGLYKGGLHDP